MSEMKYSLPGPETVTLAGHTVDKLIRAGDGNAALLYLYILRTEGKATSDDAAAALGKGPGEITTATALLSKLGLVRLDDVSGKQPPKSPKTAPNTEQNTAPDFVPDEPPDVSHRYNLSEIKRELSPGSGFSVIVEETQRSLGKVLSPDDLLRLFGIYDALHLPPEVILQLVTHCINESRLSGDGRAPRMRYIEKAAYTWEREGINTLDKAEEYIKKLVTRRSALGEIKRVLQIRDREFSATEKHYVENWIELGFTAGAVTIAYDRTMVKTGKLSWPYMDSIIKSWHNMGLHTPQEIMAKDKKGERGGVDGGRQADPRSKFGEPDRAEIERMEKVLKKINESAASKEG